MPNLPPNHVPDYVRERVYRRFGYDPHRYTILTHAGHHALLTNPSFAQPFFVIDLDDGATEGMFIERADAQARLDELAP